MSRFILVIAVLVGASGWLMAQEPVAFVRGADDNLHPVPESQFFFVPANSGDLCAEAHYHALDSFAVLATDGTLILDPELLGDPCGFHLLTFALPPDPNAPSEATVGIADEALGTSGSLGTHVVPHLLEASGRITRTQDTFDTNLFMTYSSGLGGIEPGNATVDLYIFDSATGQPLIGHANEVCNPATSTLGGEALGSTLPRKVKITTDELIGAGGFPRSVVLGFGLVVIKGDEENVNIIGAVVNSHTSGLDISVFGFTPEELRVAEATR